MENLRIIEFRGKTIHNEWHFGDLWQIYDEEKNRNIGVIIPHNTDFNDVNFDFVVLPKTIGQFTGLCDKHDNRIYEGDIIRHVYSLKKDENGQWVDNAETFLVEFDRGRFNISHLCEVTNRIEILGNKFDNPELLKV